MQNSEILPCIHCTLYFPGENESVIPNRFFDEDGQIWRNTFEADASTYVSKLLERSVKLMYFGGDIIVRMYIHELHMDSLSVNNLLNQVTDAYIKFIENDVFVEYVDVSIDISTTELEKEMFIEFPKIRLIINEASSLQHINKKIQCKILNIHYLYKNKSHGLGLLAIKGLEKLKAIDTLSNEKTWVKILLQNQNDILECQEKLIENGFTNYAKI